MKKIIVFLLLASGKSAYSQNLKVFTEIGFSINNELNQKSIGLFKATGLGYQKYLDNDWYVELCPSLFSLQFNNSNQNGQDVFRTYRFLEIDLAAKKYLIISPKSRIYMQLGLYSNYFFKKKIEIDFLETKEEYNNIGYNFGLSASFGLSTKLSNSLNFDIGLVTKSDLFFSYLNKDNKLNISRESFRISFYKRIKK